MENGIRADLGTVHAATYPNGHILRVIAGDGLLLCWVRRGTVMLCEDALPTTAIAHAVLLPCTAALTLECRTEAEILLVSCTLSRGDTPLTLAAPYLTGVLPETIWQGFAHTLHETGEFAQLRRTSLLYELLPNFLPAFTPPGRARIAPGVQALEAQYLENTAISVYADLCGLRENRFRQIFMEQYGLSPVEYRNSLRFAHAHDLMTQFGCTVAEAALASGFTSVSYFCRLHRKMYGTSPAGMEESDDPLDE